MQKTVKIAKTIKIMAASALACMAIACLPGCSMGVAFDVSCAAGSVTVSADAQFNEVELLTANALYPDVNILEQIRSNPQIALTETTSDGVKNYEATMSPQVASGDQLDRAGVILTGDKFVLVQAVPENLPEGISQDALNDPMLATYAAMANFRLIGTFDKKPVKANGAISGYQVDYSNVREPFIYAAFTKAAATSKKATSSLGNKKATNVNTVTFDSPGIINKITLNGVAQPLAQHDEDGSTHPYRVTFSEQGVQSVQVGLVSGAVKTFTFTYDTARPKANVKAGRTYKVGKAGKKVTVSDALSGLASAKLDGKKVKLKGGKASVAVKAAGRHTLVATDKAGNKLQVKFKVKVKK